MPLLTWIIIFLLLPTLAFSEVKTIELKHRAAAELLEPVRALLADGGKVQAAGNALLLIAEGDSLLAAEQLIVLLDRPLMPLVVRLRLSEQQHRVGQKLSTSSGGNATAAGQRLLGNTSRNLEQSLRVVEGSGAWLETGKEIPYRKQWSAFTGRIAGYSEQIAYKTVAAGFWVRPVQIVGNSVLVDIEPLIKQLDSRNDQNPPTIRFSQLRSRLQIPLGEWYPIGGQLQQHDQVSRDIISWRANAGEAEQVLYLRIDPASELSP